MKASETKTSIIRDAQQALAELRIEETGQKLIHCKFIRKLGSILMDYEQNARPEAITALCDEFNLNVSELEKEVSINEKEELSEARLLKERKFDMESYVGLIMKKKNTLANRVWNNYNGNVYANPDTVLLACIFDLQRHLMWKLTNCLDDISIIALVESGWDLALAESENKYFGNHKNKRNPQ